MRFSYLLPLFVASSLIACTGDVTTEGTVDPDAAIEGDSSTLPDTTSADLGAPDTNLAPDTEGTDGTELDTSTSPDTEIAPDSVVADAGGSDATAPDTLVADTSVADTLAADTFVADTRDAAVADTLVADTRDAAVADTLVADTRDAAVADTFVPDTFVPDTFAPDTFAPDTFVPDTFVPDTFVPDTSVADTADAGAWSFTEPFAVADGSSWPSPRWRELGGVALQDVQGGRSRLRPILSGYSLARMGTFEGRRDVDVSFRVSYDDIGTQGVGYYVRSNGGWLTTTTPQGQGYAVFLEGFRGSRIGVWREIAGVETEIANFTAFATPLVNGTTYGVHFRCTQATPTSTRLQARVWIASTTEPTTWQVDTTDTTAILQNISGGMAIDSWSTRTSGAPAAFTYVDDVVAFQP